MSIHQVLAISMGTSPHTGLAGPGAGGDETPLQMHQPGKGKTHRAYLWAYVWAYAAGAHGDIKAVVHDFCESRAGANIKANQIRPIAIGRNWLFADSLRAGQRAAALIKPNPVDQAQRP